MNDNFYQVNVDSNIRQHGEIITNKAIETLKSNKTILVDQLINDKDTSNDLLKLKEEMLEKADKSSHAHLTLAHYYKLEEIPFYQALETDPMKLVKINTLFDNLLNYRVNPIMLAKVQETGLVVNDLLYFDLADGFRFEFIVSYHKKETN